MSMSDTGNEPENDAAPGEKEFLNPTPILAELEKGPWPSFVRGIKELAERTRKPMLRGVLDQLEYSYNYKFKFKFSGCPNDCTNSIFRSDMAVIGIWRDAIRVDTLALSAWVARNGMEYLVNNVINRCPTKAISLQGSLPVFDNGNCVRCMHCINVMTEALSPGRERGAAILLGGKNTLKVGAMGGTVIVPFLRLETAEDNEAFISLSQRIIDWWTDNGFEHERVGETIERVGLKHFLDGVGLPVSVDMVTKPRSNPYYKSEY